MDTDSDVLTTLANGVRVVEALAGNRLTVREIASVVGVPRQSTYRLVHTLRAMGWVGFDPETSTYGLTTTLWSIVLTTFEGADLRERYTPALRGLAEHTGETVHLSVYDQGHVIYIDKVDGWQPIRASTTIGGRVPAHCTSAGKLLLAHRPPEERERVLAGQLERFTDTTITDPAALRGELENVAAQNYAINNGEWRKDVGGVAVPVRSPLQEVIACVGFSGPVARIMDNRESLIRALHEGVAGAGDAPSPVTRPANGEKLRPAVRGAPRIE